MCKPSRNTPIKVIARQPGWTSKPSTSIVSQSLESSKPVLCATMAQRLRSQWLVRRAALSHVCFTGASPMPRHATESPVEFRELLRRLDPGTNQQRERGCGTGRVDAPQSWHSGRRSCVYRVIGFTPSSTMGIPIRTEALGWACPDCKLCFNLPATELCNPGSYTRRQ